MKQKKEIVGRRDRGEGSLLKVPRSRFWYVQFYREGRQVRISTGTTVKQKALEFLRKQMGDRDRGFSPLSDVKRSPTLISAPVYSPTTWRGATSR